MAYPSVCVKNLPTLAQVMKKGASVGPFLIMLIYDFVVKVTRGGRRKLELKLSVDLPVLRTTQEKQDFQQACAHDSEATKFVDQLATNGAHHYHGPFPFRWASGGYLPIFVIEEVRYCMLFLRDLRPVAGWNVANGASNSPVELWHVELMVEREPKEEILVISRTQAEEFCYRLESPGGSIQTIDHHKQVLKLLGKNIRIEMMPLIGKMLPDSPDQIEVSAEWARDHSPHVTTPGFLILNTENGENGIEFIQVVEWEIPERLHNLVFYDAEVHEQADPASGKARGTLVQQAVGLFPLDQLIPEFQKDDPRPQPKYVFDKGSLLSGEVLQAWLEDRPYSQQWCPVARKVLKRYLDHTLAGRNSFLRTSPDTWSVTFEGKTIFLKHCLGLVYIAHLLKHAGESISCGMLSSLTHPGDPESGMAQAQWEDGLSNDGSGSAQALFDPQALKDIRRYLEVLKREQEELQQDLEKARENNDQGVIEQLTADLSDKTDELERATRQFRKDLRLGGGSRSFTEARERMRCAVAKNIDRALVDIRQQDERVWRHLKDSIKKGFDCLYSSEPPLVWSV